MLARTAMTTSSEAENITSSAPAGCIVLQFGEYIPWNNPVNVISYQIEELIYTLKVVVFFPALFLIACPANLINMIVFYRHGLKERINVCLFALSLADELYMINNVLWYGEQLYHRFTTNEKYGPLLRFLTEWHLLGLHGFIWVSQVLSAIIASERCFCVLYPLRSQTMLQTSTMVIIIVIVHVVILSLVSLDMIRYNVACVYDPLSSISKFMVISSEYYFRNQKLIDYLDIFVLGIGLPGIITVVMMATTAVTAIKLRQAALWRAGSSSNSNVSERDIALTKMLVSNSVFFIICLIPFIVFRLVFLFMPEVNAGGWQHNLYVVMHETLSIISYINATFNFVIYYTMGSRYRQTFWQLFERSGQITNNNRVNMR